MKYFLIKLLQSAMTLFLVSILVFAAVRASGNPVRKLLPIGASDAQVEYLTDKLGLDRPLYRQFAIYMKDILHGDFGTSYSSNRSVLEMIGEKLPYTLELAVASILVAMMATIILGSLAAMKRNTIVDKAICGMAAFFEAAPSFFLAILLIQWFGVKLKIFPVSGADTLLHLVLPAALMGFSISARTTMLLRNNMIAAIDSDYVKFARLKGLKEYHVILRHALRNSLSSVLALSSFMFALLITGSVSTEAIFARPGLGTLSYTAVMARDYPLVQGIVLILSALIVLLSFAMDVATAAMDPRIREEKQIGQSR